MAASRLSSVVSRTVRSWFKARPTPTIRKRLFRCQPLEDRLAPAVYTVSSTADTNTGSGNSGTLRYCIGLANAALGSDQVVFDSSFSTAQTITLSGTELLVTDSLNITGPGQSLLTISSNNASRIFEFKNASSTSTLSDVTLKNGSLAPAYGLGGGILNSGTLTVTNATIRDCSATSIGGGIANAGSMTITYSTIAGNFTDYTFGGGGISNSNSKTLTIANSTLSNNTAPTGGGIANLGVLSATNSTFANNIANSPLSATGGGIAQIDYEPSYSLSLTNCTLTGNTANTKGGGLFISHYATGVPVSVTNTIVAGNTAPSNADVGGTITSSTTNLLNMYAAAAGLGSLGNYGGSTQTVPLLASSPGVNAGSGVSVSFDQRGTPYTRSNGTTDFGAYEVQAFVVDSTADTVDGDTSAGKFTLREAIAAANAIPGSDSIAFSTLFNSAQTITLTGTELLVTDSLNITGPGQGLLTISGNKASRIFEFSNASSSSVLSNVTLRDGANFGTSNKQGGGIYNSGTLDIADATIRDCRSELGGAGIANGGSLTLTNSTIAGNSSDGTGGGIFNGGKTLKVANSTINNNTCVGPGGGISDFGSGTVTLTNSTVANNSASKGGGILRYEIPDQTGPLNLLNCTITGNTGGTGGGFCLYPNPNSKIFSTLTNTIVAGNTTTTGADVSGTINSTTSLLNMSAAAAGLGTLGNYGGPTQTVRLLVGSPARDAGSGVGLLADQRGSPFSRGTGNGVMDIGAFEVQPALVVDNTSDFADGFYSAGNFTLREAIALANATPGPDTITFSSLFNTAKTITVGGTLQLTDSVYIGGPGADLLTINGNNAATVFNFSNSTATSTISGMTVTGGNDTTNTGAGGVYNTGTLTILNTTIRNNKGSYGGGICNNSSGTLFVTNSTISSNTATKSAGGIRNRVSGTLTVTNSTIVGNSGATRGGAINSSGALTVINTTITGNSASNGGGISNYLMSKAVTISNSILSGNTAPNGPDFENIYSGTVNVNFCAIGSTSGFTPTGANNLIGKNLLIGALGSYDGKTQTIPLLPGSPAIDAGSATIAFDQRGYSRVGSFDIGAFESFGFYMNPTSGKGQQTALNMAFPSPLVVTVIANNAIEPVSGGQVTFTAPGSGATATPSPQTVTIDGSSKATIGTFTANGTNGVYNVVTTARGSSSNTLGLTNGLNEPPSLVVTTAADVVNNLDNLTSLREAMNLANSSTTGTVTITFSSLFNSAQTITLTGILAVTRSTIINGPGASLLTIAGNNTFQAFSFLKGSSTSTLSGVRLTGFNASGGSGGAIVNESTLTVANCTISNSTASSGGGIASGNVGGNLTVVGSTFSNNLATFGGGAIANSGVSATVNNSLFSNNTSNNRGGAISTSYVMTVNNTTFTGNVASSAGAAMFNDATVTLNNSTMVANSVGSGSGGGGIRNTGALTIASTIVSDNLATSGAPDISSTTAVAANFSALGPINGYTLTGGSANNLMGKTLLLGPLGNYGGPTATMPLLAGSPAINAGSNPNSLTADQRGFPFVRASGTVDIGAYEVQAANIIVDSTGDANDGNYTDGNLTLREAVAQANLNPGADAVAFSALFNVPQTITLTNGQLDVNESVTITGPGANLLTVNGNGGKRDLSFNIGSSTSTLSGLTLTGATNASDGFGIFNQGTLTATNVDANGNRFGIWNNGSAKMTLSGSTIRSNTMGIWNNGSANLAVINSTIAGNSGTTEGGAIFNNNATLTITNSTITGNSAKNEGGGIYFYNGGALTVTSSIISGNNAPTGPDISRGSPIITFSAIGSSSGFSLGGGSGNNLAFGANLKLGTLGYNGGRTQTIPLLAGSPAINAGSNSLSLTTDQRGTGFTRTSGTADIGAYEVQAFGPIVVDNTGDLDDGVYTAGNLTLREAIALAVNPGPDTITFSSLFNTPQTITLGGTELMVTDSVTITGPGADCNRSPTSGSP